MKAKINIKNIYSYIIGNYRYQLYYSKNFSWLIRNFIKRQITLRINSMDKDCFNNGQCKMCGCKTTALQMANKECDKPCYPEMLSRKKWIKFVLDSMFGISTVINNRRWIIDLKNKKFKLYKDE